MPSTNLADADVDLTFPSSWDHTYIQYDQGLKPPIDFLPNVGDEIEQKLLHDAQFVYETLTLWDTKHKAALSSDNPESRHLAQEIKESHNAFVGNLLNKMKEAKKWVSGQNIILNSIHTKYQNADRWFFQEQLSANMSLPMDTRVKMRLEAFAGRIQIASDVDKTLTTHADYLQMIPGSVQAENYMAHEKHGREQFPLVFSRYWREAMIKLKDNFHLIGENVPFRFGVHQFFQLTEAAGVPVTITSANFRPLIDGVMSRIPATNILHTYAVEQDDINATDKATVLQKLAIENPDLALIYLGDGESDIPAAEKSASRIIAFYFALKGGKFAEELLKKGLPFYEYESFDDVNETLTRLGLLETQQVSE